MQVASLASSRQRPLPEGDRLGPDTGNRRIPWRHPRRRKQLLPVLRLPHERAPPGLRPGHALALRGPAEQALPAGAEVAEVRRHGAVPVELYDDAGTGVARLQGVPDLHLTAFPPFGAVREERQQAGERGATQGAAGGGAGLPHDRGGVDPGYSRGGVRRQARGHTLVHGPGGARQAAARRRRQGSVCRQGGAALRLAIGEEARRGDLRAPDQAARARRRRAMPFPRCRAAGKEVLPKARRHSDHAPDGPQGEASGEGARDRSQGGARAQEREGVVLQAARYGELGRGASLVLRVRGGHRRSPRPRSVAPRHRGQPKGLGEVSGLLHGPGPDLSQARSA